MMDSPQKIDSTGLRRRPNPVWSVAALVTAMPFFAICQEAKEDIRGPRGLVEIPEPPNYLLWIAIALGIAVLVILIWKLATRKRKSTALPASALALAELEKCQSYLTGESAEPLANGVTDVVRSYISARFGIAAPRKTTEEFLNGLQTDLKPEIAPFREDLSRFLRSCDAIKYGQGEMETDNRNGLIESARHFIEVTRETKEKA